MSALIDNPRAVGAGHAYGALVEAANEPSPEASPAVCEIANKLAAMTLFPEDAIALLDAVRAGVLRNNGHINLHQEIAEELATLADWLSKEQA